MSDTIRASKIIASALLISGGAIGLAITAAIRNTDGGPIQLGLMVLVGVGVWLLIPAWLGRASPQVAAKADDVDVDAQVRREVERMRSIARSTGPKPSEATGE